LKTTYNLLKDAFSIRNTSTCQYDSLHGYISNFSRNGDVDGWDIYSNICLYGVWDTVLFGTSLERECYISRTNIFIPIPAEEYHILKVTMKLTPPDGFLDEHLPTKGRIMWQTVADPSWNEDKSIDFDLVVNDQWYSYILNTGESQYWQGDIDNIRIYPFIDGKPDIRFTIKTINVDSTNYFRCINTQCSFYSNFRHPCEGIGKRASITSGIPKEFFTTVSGVNDKLILNIDDYGSQQINIGNFTNVTGSDMAKILVNRISLVDVGQYTYVEATFDTTKNKFTIYSGSSVDGGVIHISGPAAKELGFTDELGNEVVTKTIGCEPASGFDYAASRRLKGFEINALIDADTEHTAYYHNPNQYTVEAGRPDFIDSMSSSHAPRPIDIDYYKEIDGNNKLIIDGSHPVNDSGRLTHIKVNGTRCKDADDNIYASSRFSESFSKVVLLRPYRVDNINESYVKIIHTAILGDPEKGAVHTSSDVTYSVDVNWLVNKGDLIGFYNFNVLCPHSLNQHTPNAVYFEVNGLPDGRFYIGKPAAKGVIGLSFYARSSRIQENIQLEIDLGRRINIEELTVHGKELKTNYEYNVASCLDVTWQVDLHNETHWHKVGHCYYGTLRRVEHRNKAYGLECLDDCVTTPDNGQQGSSYTSRPLGGSLHLDGTNWIQNDDPDTYSGLVTIGEHSYFYVNGDGEWNNAGCGTPSPYNPDAAYHTMEFQSPWSAGPPYDYEFDPITFTLLFPPGRQVPIHRSAIYFKESNNFKHISLSYYLGEFGPNGNAEELHWEFVPKFNSVELDGTMLYEGVTDGSRSSEKYDSIYFSNPWPMAKPKYVNGRCVNWNIYQTMMNERMNTLKHYFTPIPCYGFRYHNEWHLSTKITEIEVFSGLYMKPSLLDNVSIYTSLYGEEWNELVFTADEMDDERINSHVTGSPRYFYLEIQSQDIFKLKELNATISTEHIRDLECYDTIDPDIAPKGVVTTSKELIIENTYNIPLNLIVDIPTNLFKQRDILSWIKLDSEDSTLNAEIGPGAIVRKNQDYQIYLSSGQVANNCNAYYLNNLVENKLSYQLLNNHKWSSYKTLHHNEDVAFTNELIGKQYSASFEKVSSKYWKLAVFDTGRYLLNSFKLYNGLILLDNYNIYIQAKSDFFSGKFKTSIDPDTGNILPVAVVEDDFSNHTYLDYWEYYFGLNSVNSNLIEAHNCLYPYLDAWGIAEISKSFLPGVLSFSLDVIFRFDLPNNLKYSIELIDSNNRVLFTMSLTGQCDSTITLDIWASFPMAQEIKHSSHYDLNPMLYAGGQTLADYRYDELTFSVEKVGNTFSYIKLTTESGDILFSTESQISFPDRVSKLAIRYTNEEANEYYIQTTKISTIDVSFKALPYLSAQESIAFDFRDSEPVTKFEIVHTQSELLKPAILISNLDQDDYIFWALNFTETGDLAPVSYSVYTDNGYRNQSGASILDSKPWNLFLNRTSSYNYFSFKAPSCFVKYDFGVGNERVINYICYTAYNSTSYQTPDIVKIYGTNKYGDAFIPEDTTNKLLVEFNINKYNSGVNPINEEYFNNNAYFRYIVVYWPKKGDTVHSLVLAKKIIFGRRLETYNPYNTRTNEYEVLLIHSNSTVENSNFIDSSFYNHLIIPLYANNTVHSLDEVKFGNSSIYFAGRYSPLIIGEDTSESKEYFNFSDNDFTIDTWLYIDTRGNHRRICSTRSLSGVQSGMTISLLSNGTVRFRDISAGTVISSFIVPVAEWVHIAIVGFNGVIKLYLNGVADNNVLNQNTLSYPGTRFIIGRLMEQTTYAFSGYMDEFRVNNGVALWVEDFSPPEFINTFGNSQLVSTIEEDYINYLAIDLQHLHDIDFLRNSGPSDDLYNVWNNSDIDFSSSNTDNIEYVDWSGTAAALLLNFEHFIDSSDSLHELVVNGDVSISTIDSPVLPNGHAIFNGGTISIATSDDFNFYAMEFTIDFRISKTLDGHEGIISKISDVNTRSSFSIYFGDNNYLEAALYINSSVILLKSQFAFTLFTWYHVALVRSSGTIGLYVNGEVQSSNYIGTYSEINSSICPLIIGGLDGSNFIGSMDEVRIIKDGAYWNHNFTPLNEAYTNNTVGDKTNARWIKIPMVCGDNIKKHLQYLDVYPNIITPYMRDGGYNCDWTPFPVASRLTDYSTSARNLAPFSTILNIEQSYYDFDSSELDDWNDLVYPVTIASGVTQTNFSGEFLDSIWEVYSEEFTDVRSSLEQSNKALRINFYETDDGLCSFRTKDIVGDCTLELELDFSISHKQAGDFLTFLNIYSQNSAHKVSLVRRNTTVDSSPALQLWKDDSKLSTIMFPDETINEVTKLRLEKRGYTFIASYFNYKQNTWIFFSDHINYELGYDYPVYFELLVDKYTDFPAETLKVTNASLTIENDTSIGIGKWGTDMVDDDIDQLCLTYLTPNILMDIGPKLTLDDLIIGRQIQNFEFSYYNQGPNGAGFAILDSEGDEILGVATNSPEWMVNSKNGWKIIKCEITLGNNDWYRVNITFNWVDYSVTITWASINSTDFISYTTYLMKQTNVASFQIRAMAGRSWGLSYQDIRFDNISVIPTAHWLYDWIPYNCLTGEDAAEGYDNSWGFPASDPKPTLVLDLGGLFPINNFVLHHTPTSEDTDWMNTDYTISYAITSSGIFTPLIDITGNTDAVRHHTLEPTVECAFIKLEINSYTKPAIPPVITTTTQEDVIETTIIDGGFLREFEIWQAEGNEAINSKDHPIVCIDLKDQFNVNSHILGVVGRSNRTLKRSNSSSSPDWYNDEEFFQYSDDFTTDPNKVAFSLPAQSAVLFSYPNDYIDVNGIGGPVILSNSTFLARGHYEISWQLYRPDSAELIKMDIIGINSYTITTDEIASSWIYQTNLLYVEESGYYSIQVRATASELTGSWGVRGINFLNSTSTTRWVAVRRITAENFTYDTRDPNALEPELRGVAPGIDFLPKILIYTGDDVRPTEYSWWWSSIISELSNDSINTKVGKRSLKISYPASKLVDYVRFREGDHFGTDSDYSFKDALSMWLYISDIDKLDIENGGIAFGCFDGWESTSTVFKYEHDFTGTTIQKTIVTWNFIDMNLDTGWNKVILRFDKYSSIYPEFDTEFARLSSLLNFRYNSTSSFGMVFSGKDAEFYMLLDGIHIERNYFYDEVVYGNKGLCLTWGEFAEIPLSGTSLRRGSIEMWLKLYTASNGIDIYGNVASRTIFTLINNNDECITLSIRGSHWFEIGIGNVKASFSSLYVDSNKVDLSNFVFSIGDKLHLALTWSHDGSEMSNVNTLRLFVNGIECLSSNSTWDISDNKGVLLRLGGGNSYLSTNDNDDGSAIFSNVKIYNYCKEEFNLAEHTPIIYDALSANNFVRLSADDITFYNNTALELPLLFESVQPGEKIKVYTKVDKTKPELYNQFTGTISVDWEVPV